MTGSPPTSRTSTGRKSAATPKTSAVTTMMRFARTWRSLSSTVAGLLVPTFPSRAESQSNAAAAPARRSAVAASQNAPQSACSYMPRGVCPRPTAAAHSRVRSVPMSTGSSDEMEHLTPAPSMRGSGCSSSDGATPRSTLLRGVTSQTMPRAAISARSAGSSTARTPCRRRSACSTSSAPRTDAGPATSPACGAALSPPSRASANGRANSSGGNRCSLPPRLMPTTPRSRNFTAQPTRCSAISTGKSRVMSGREADVDAVDLARLVGAAAVALEGLLPRRAPHHRLRGREQRLGVEAALRLEVGGVVHHDLVEVALAAQRLRRLDPDADEVVEVPGPAEAGEPGLGLRRQAHVVAARDLEQARRASPWPRGARAARSWGRRPRSSAPSYPTRAPVPSPTLAPRPSSTDLRQGRQRRYSRTNSSASSSMSSASRHSPPAPRS